MREKLTGHFSGVILFLAGTALLFLAAVSACSTCLFVKDELSYWVSDSPLLHLLSAFLVTAGLYGFSGCKAGSRMIRRIRQDRALFKKIQIGLTLALFLLCCAEVLCTQYLPTWDQASALKAAKNLKNGNYIDFIPGGYIDCYTSQCGIVFAEYLLSFLFGTGNIVVFQLINAVCMALLFYFLSEITELCGMGECCALGVSLLSILFLPDLIYVSYIYGSVPGLMLAVYSIYQMELFFRNGRFRHALFSAAAIAFSVALKQNYAIFVIGLVITAALHLLRSRQKLCAVFIALAIILTGILSTVPRLAISKITGARLNQGCSPFAWVAMGLQESPGYDPGWYNEYNKYLYIEYGYGNASTRQASVNNIKKSILQFVNGERNPVSFFLSKITSEWNNPTFSAWFETSLQSGSQISVPGWLRSFFSVQGEYQASRYLNFLQFLILFGAAVWFALSEKKSAFPYIEGALIFLGGFLFSVIWEAKARYTAPYFILLFPYACGGYRLLISLPDKEKSGLLRLRRSFLFSALTAAALVVFLCLTGNWALLSHSDADFPKALEGAACSASDAPEDGDYLLVMENAGASLALTYDDSGDDRTVFLQPAADQAGTVFTVRTSDGESFLCPRGKLLYLTPEKENKVCLAQGNWGDSELWKLARQADGSYVLKDISGHVLTAAEEGSVAAAEFEEGNVLQHWRFVPAEP